MISIKHIFTRLFNKSQPKTEYSKNNGVNVSLENKYRLKNYYGMNLRDEFLPWDEIILIITPKKGHNTISYSIDIYVNSNMFGMSQYASEINKIVKTGTMNVHIKWIEVGIIELYYCIEEGSHGDEDGYGVEPDTWIKSYFTKEGNMITPFSLCDSKANSNIDKWITIGISPLDEKGKLMICSFDKVNKIFKNENFFIVKKENSYGVIDKNQIIIIPIEYKDLHFCEDSFIRVQQHNDLLYGIINLNNEFVIPPNYQTILYISEGDNKGCYETKHYGISHIIDKNDRMISVNIAKNFNIMNISRITIDTFGNKIILHKMNDGIFHKITQANKVINFMFLNDKYSYTILDKAEIIKVYWKNYRSERKLVKDMYNRLFHYRYDERMVFDEDDDSVDILWTLVADEQDSDDLVKKSNTSLLRVPYVITEGKNGLAAHEEIV